MGIREKLEQAIALQESLRGSVDDAVIDAAVAALRKQLADQEGTEQQRKLVSILFMDIAGHTEIVRDLDPEDNLTVIDPALKRLAGVVEANGGHVARYQGDGFKAVFGLPTAQENDADNAVRAGLGILSQAEKIAEVLKAEWGIERFQVRVGIDTGSVTSGSDEETEGEDTIKGPPVNLAARLESAARPGTVVISHDTYQLVRGAFTLERLDPVEAKGFPEPVPVYRVQSEKPRSFRTRRHGVEGVDTRMIGRDRELDLLQEILAEVLEEVDRQFVTVVGEAGVGKSRLLYEFENWVDLEPVGVQLYRGRAHLETRRLPYSLIRSIFNFRFDLRDNEPASIVREKWLTGFREGWRKVKHVEDEKIELQGQILGHLLGIDFSESPRVAPILKDPQQLRNRSVAYLTEYFQAVAKNSAVLILLEDLHWADDGSLEILNQLGLRLKGAAVLIVAASRPELYERRPNWFEGWEFHRRMNLHPLSRRVCRGLVGEVLQKLPDVPRDLEEMIVANSEGNPFYVEELVKMMIEAGVVKAIEPSWALDEQKLYEIEVPGTLTGVLQARLERLPHEERVLVQQAAVVGRVFWDRVVWYLNREGDGRLNEETVGTGLVNLRGKELIYRREQSTFEDALEYIFKHAVLREVTYAGVLKRVRKVYHRKVAEWLMEQRGDRKNEIVGLVADHLEAAGELEDALAYLRWSGEVAAGKFANEEAIDYFSRALRLVPGTDLELRYKLLIEREKLLKLHADREAQRQDLIELEEIVERLDDDVKRMEVGIKWAEFAVEHREANQFGANKAMDVIQRAEALGNNWYAARGYLALGRAYLFSEDHDKPIEDLLKNALSGFRNSADRAWEGRTLRTLGIFSSMVQRDLIAQREFVMQALNAAQETGDLEHLAEAINHLGINAVYLGQFEEGRKYYTQYLNITREIGSKRQEAAALNNFGDMYLDMEDYPSAREMLEQSLETAREIDSSGGVISGLVGLGEAFEGLNLSEQAMDTYQQALELVTDDTGVSRPKWRARAGIIRAKRKLGETGQEKDFIDDFLSAISQVDNLRWNFPLTVLLLCVKLLLEEKDERARAILDRAYEQVMIVAQKIEDESLRKSFLENLPWNREILSLWQTYGSGA